MKKLLLLGAAVLVFQATPVLADNHKGGHGNKGAKMFEKHDTNGDGAISEAEFLEHAKAKFSERDTNGDGSITMEEAKAAKEAKRGKMRDKMKDRMKDKKDSAE